MTSAIDWASPLPALMLTAGRFLFKRWFSIHDDLQVLKDGICGLKADVEKIDLRLKHLEEETDDIDREVQDIRSNGCHQMLTHKQ